MEQVHAPDLVPVLLKAFLENKLLKRWAIKQFVKVSKKYSKLSPNDVQP